jgi:threonine dehydrogenase-like Zn-dependent dehydrogenase
MVEVRADAPPPGHVSVAVDGCGVCGSNLPVWEGRPWFDYPLPPGRPGHEAWGRVDQVSADVAAAGEIAIGDAVAFLSDDAFATSVHVPAAKTVVLPASLRGRPFPGEALGSAVNAAARSGFERGQAVCVVGAGFMGAVIIALASAAGARVVAVSRRRFALEMAAAMGAATMVPFEGPATTDAVLEQNGGALFDVVVEAVGTQEPLDIAARLCRVRGRLVIAGYHQDGLRSVDMQLWNWRGIDVVNAHERDPLVRVGGIRAAVAAVESGQLDPSPLYTHSFPLDRLGDAFEAMAERPDGFLKALVVAS